MTPNTLGNALSLVRLLPAERMEILAKDKTTDEPVA